MQANTKPRAILDHLIYLPAFARYIKQNKLEEFVDLQFTISKEIDLPILRQLSSLPKEELREISRKSSLELLSHFEANEAEKLITISLERYRKNQLQFIDSVELAAEDITLTLYLRKKSFLYFLPDYSAETDTIVEIIKELDDYLVSFEIRASKLYLQILNERIEEHVHFIEKITNTSPGLIFVYDLAEVLGFGKE